MRGQRARQDHLAEHVDGPRAPRLRADATRRAVEPLDAVDGVQQDREQRADEGDEDHALLGRREHQDRERDPGHGRDRPQHLERRQQRLRAPAGSGRSAGPAPMPSAAAMREAEEDAPQAASHVLRELGRAAAARRPASEHLGRRRHVLEAKEQLQFVGSRPARQTASHSASRREPTASGAGTHARAAPAARGELGRGRELGSGARQGSSSACCSSQRAGSCAHAVPARAS